MLVPKKLKYRKPHRGRMRGQAKGGTIGDLNQRRGQVQDVGSRGVKRIVTALVPLRNMFGYSTRIRSLTASGCSSCTPWLIQTLTPICPIWVLASLKP